MKDIAELVMDLAKSRGCDYADIRIIEQRQQAIEMRNQVPAELHEEESLGYGIRILNQGGWGFAASNRMSRDEIEKTFKKAFDISEASRRPGKQEIHMAPETPIEATWETPCLHDPFDIPLEEKLQLLEKVYALSKPVKDVSIISGQMAFKRRKQFFANTEGSRIEQKLYLSGVGYSVIASNGQEMQIRSYPSSFGGQYASMGYELVYEWQLLENAERIADEAAALLRAPQCPTQVTDVILDSSQLALQIHESCGHPTELDRVLGYEANFAGTSFLTLDKYNSFRYGSDHVTLYADPRPNSGLGAGTYAFDDEGVAAQRTDLVKNGIFTGYLYSRDTAGIIGASRSNGCMRCANWDVPPIIRMNNINLEPGEWTLEDLIADTKEGIFLETNRSWSIDDKRYNFQFGTEIAWEIRNGKKVRMLKNPTYGGTTPIFWRSCDAVCNASHWILWGIPSCGKGQPQQVIATSHGASPARFRNVNVGVGHA